MAERAKTITNILGSSFDVISIINKSGKRIHTSSSASQLYGYTMEELIGKPFLDIVYEADKEISAATFAKIFEPESIKYFENRLVKKDGSLLNMSWSINLDKELDHVYIIGRDITEKINTEEALKESEKQYRSLIKNLNTGILKQGPSTEILLSNPAALEMLGLSEDQILGKTSFHPNWNVIHENGDDFPGETHPVSVAIATKKSVHNVVMGVYRPVTKDRVWLLVNAEPAFDTLGQLDHVICTFNDITEQIVAQNELTETKKRLLKLNDELQLNSIALTAKNIELERFTHVASHDLKEPLRMVSSFMKLLEKKFGNVLGETGKQYIDFAIDGAERMRGIITDLLSYSQAGDSTQKVEDVDMNKVMEEVTILFDNESYQSEAEISIEHLPIIKAGKIPMTQLMQNLIGNSIKYKRDIKAEILVSAEENEAEWIFSVKDNGIGISAEDTEKVFVMFQRLPTKNKISGTGIGLASCKKIVESYNGRIWVTSELGVGSTFKFSIPKV
ncbi:PAS domain S-box protein [Parasediminibacterium sp. JCM 36343]|uniref:PAS domain-containing sensor histidine kinase n=1 Tax=Parasediminibacterium sp. JCM 36343 TaxID=3374279 RepID=UPI003979AC54